MRLLDVNVLIALVDASHEHHRRVGEWWRGNAARGWASCPLTQNGAARVLGHPSYPGGPGTVARAVRLLERLCQHPAHQFWGDDISILDVSRFPCWREVGSRALADLYLLALASSRGGKFVTLDRGIDGAKVTGGPAALEVIL